MNPSDRASRSCEGLSSRGAPGCKTCKGRPARGRRARTERAVSTSGQSSLCKTQRGVVSVRAATDRPQRSFSMPRLGGSTRQRRSVACAVAWLHPGKDIDVRHKRARRGFRSHYQAAVLHGLGIVALGSMEGEPWIWEPTEVQTCDEFMNDLVERVEEKLNESRARLAEILRRPRGRSRAAEVPVREAVGAALGHDFQPGQQDVAFELRGGPRTRTACGPARERFPSHSRWKSKWPRT